MLDQALIARVTDLAARSVSRNILTHTDFLTPSECALLLASNQHPIPYRFGGYDGAERTMLFFLPDYLDACPDSVSECISAVKCTARFSELTHRDYLGALLSLGIKRNCIGDILVYHQESVILLNTKIAPFVCENLTHIGRGGVSCSQIELCEITPPAQKFHEIEATVASLRADSVFSAAIGISREKAANLIREGACTVNWLPIDSPSAPISEADILSTRGFGRAKLAQVGGTSKKGRIFIKIHIYE